MGPKEEEGKTIEGGEGGREGNMSGGKVVPVARIKAPNWRTREDENQKGASWSAEKMRGRWGSGAETLSEQRRITWLNVPGSSTYRGQSGELSESNQEGGAAR